MWRIKLAAALTLFVAIVAAACASNQMTFKQDVTVAVDDEDAPAVAVEAASKSEPTPIPGTPLQVMNVPQFNRFDLALDYFRSEESRIALKSGMRLASLPLVAVTRPERQYPKKAEAAAQKPKLQLAAANWNQMNGRERWQFVAGFIKMQHWECPPSGMSRAREEAELAKYSWSTVRNFGFNKCKQSG